MGVTKKSINLNESIDGVSDLRSACAFDTIRFLNDTLRRQNGILHFTLYEFSL